MISGHYRMGGSPKYLNTAEIYIEYMLGSVTDWIVLIIVILVLFGGAKKIPELARALGRAFGEFKKGQMEVENEIKKSLEKEQENQK